MKKKKNLFSLLVIFLFVVVCVLLDGRWKVFEDPKRVIQSDVYCYYEYLPATFIHKDVGLTFVDKDTSKTLQQIYWHIALPNGKNVIKTSMGNAIMYAPAFFIAHALAPCFGYERTGYTKPYTVALAIISMLYVVLGFFVLRKLLLLYFSDAITALSLFIVMGTNLLYYTTLESAMSHSYSFFLFACFILLTKLWFDNPKWKYSIYIGITFGLISLIRPSNALIVIVFLLFGVKQLSDLKSQCLLFVKNYKKLITIVLLAFVVWLPQLIYWKYITGSWLFWSYGETENFYFNNPHIFEFLFGFRKGWLIYTPVMIFSIIGFYFVWKNYKDYFFSFLFFFVINVYVLSCWWCWWFGGSFGMRTLVESYAILVFPLAAFLQALSKTKLYVKTTTIVLIVILFSITVFNFVKFRYHTIHYDSMTKEAYLKHFFSIRPSWDYYELLVKPNYDAAREGIDQSLPDYYKF